MKRKIKLLFNDIRSKFVNIHIHDLIVGKEGINKDLLSGLQSLVTILAIIFAGFWFLISDEGSRKLNISHSFKSYGISENYRWVGVSVKIENAGRRLVNIENGKVWLQKILPIPRDIKKLIDSNQLLIPKDKREVQWNIIGKIYNEEIKAEILPGETDELEYDFIIPCYVKVVKLYSHYGKQDDDALVWQHTSVHEVKEINNKELNKCIKN